ncbi:PIN-like domain-containing protein [Spirillospora sp. CA-128828]|uniref:PIN-like domain-containing protein n=1 Tax=Spirillospora sp. CA-128828 TaxID=3240033 RepID=UPI003D8A9A4F
MGIHVTDRASSQPPLLLERYQAWLEPDGTGAAAKLQPFLTSGLIVLDTNVLLDLYRYTPQARGQILDALQLVSSRLWLPHQVGLEFVRGRWGVVADRTDQLRRAKSHLDPHFREAWRNVQQALRRVHALLGRFAADESGQAELDKLINASGFDELIRPWRGALGEHIDALKNAQDVMLNDIVSGTDPILPQVAALYGDRVGPQPAEEEIQQLVEHAVGYRYPNKIPPGFRDMSKDTPLLAAGDYLLWEQVIAHVGRSATQERVLIVSGDVKDDWYEPRGIESGSPRPWPSLIQEFRSRTRTDLLVVESKSFFQGVAEVLDAKITASTVEEISRTTEARDEAKDEFEGPVTAEDAAALPPPEGTALAAYRAAHLSSSVIRDAVTSSSYRMFQWWLIGATEEFGLRKRGPGEPPVDLVALSADRLPPAPDWILANVLRHGEVPTPSTTWIAPWMVQVIEMSPRADRASVLRLARRQLVNRAEGDPSVGE